MLIDMIMWFLLAAFACVGLVQFLSWIVIRRSRKDYNIFRVIPIGGSGQNPGQQMALMYTCLQWEANPSGQVFVLYNAGLDEKGVKDCKTLAKSAGVLYANNETELLCILNGGRCA